jgi:glucose-6-phosphate 1-dehydrogenase
MENYLEEPFVMVIFGATGDLAHHKLIPALFSIYKQAKLPKKFLIIGFSRREISKFEFRESFEQFYGKDRWDDFTNHLIYLQSDFSEKEGYLDLMRILSDFDKDCGFSVQKLLYLATPPVNYDDILDNLEKTDLSNRENTKNTKKVKIIVEKPFGKDLKTAEYLENRLYKIFKEEQIFRVDHYLGKETVQNVIAFRFANGIFEPVWNNKFIDHVQITFAESKGIGTRGKFFDGVGTLRDITQNHIMQLLAAVAMDQPVSFEREAIRDARAKAINTINCLTPYEVTKFVVRGQYEGYGSEKDVDTRSMTETFTALKLYVNTSRFKDVPFYIRAGKMMPKNSVYISIVFIQTCHILFKEYGCPEIGNVLTIKIQPDEGITLRVIAKEPGDKLALGTVNMKFKYEEEFGEKIKDAYEKILLDILSGDQMLFNRTDELQSSWRFITQILNGWELQNAKSSWKMPRYRKGTWGPKEAVDLIEKDNRKWIES